MKSKMIVGFVMTALCVNLAFAVEDIHTGTVVVGSGISGMKAAIDLKTAKKDVVVVEKMPFMGGTTNLAAQYFVVVETEPQTKAGKTLTVADYLKRKEKTGLSKEALLREAEQLYAADGIVKWLNDNGAELTRVVSDYQIGIAGGTSLGPRLMQVMSKKAKEVGVPVKLNTKAVALIIEDGKVKGIEVEQGKGIEVEQGKGIEVEQGKEKYKIFADNVVLATGGFANNPALMERYAPEWKGLPTTTAKGSTGDAIILGQPLKVLVEEPAEVYLNPSMHSQDGNNVSMSAARLEGGIIVNLKGERFCDDYTPNYTTMSRLMMKQPEGKSFVIIDDKSMKASKRLQGFKQKGYFVEAPTVAELAKKIGVPAENLEKTIKRYSEFVKNGKDEDFGRKYNMKTDFTTPPYYATSTTPGVQTTPGGVKTNSFMQARTTDGKIIPNVYVVGEASKGTATVYGM
ncbi:FAD-dependent oxidoreductase, partial [Turicimonas muris]